jgi:hypothetical protein
MSKGDNPAGNLIITRIKFDAWEKPMGREKGGIRGAVPTPTTPLELKHVCINQSVATFHSLEYT